MAQGNKARLNVTVDPDIYREARRVFKTLDMNMSAFIEMQLAAFLEVNRPLISMLDDIEQGKRDPSELKTAGRTWLSHAQRTVGEHLAQFGKVTGEISDLIEKDDFKRTDKK